MFEHAFIHEYGNGKLEPEHRDLKEVLESRHIPVTLFTQKRMDRKQLPLGKNCLVAGDHTVIAGALKQLGIAHTPKTCYPEPLKHFLKRRIWSSTLQKVLHSIQTGEIGETFVKPKRTAKLFTGAVIRGYSDQVSFSNATLSSEVYCSDVVNWLSEYRVFVCHGKIAGTRHYAGDVNRLIDMDEVKAAIELLEASGKATAGYGIDFGVLDTGETALIEWNDGYALGSYQLDKEVYTNLITARWTELISSG